MRNIKNSILASALLVVAGVAQQASAAEGYDAEKVRIEELGGKPFLSSERNAASSELGTYDAAKVRAEELGGKPFLSSARNEPPSQFGSADVEQEDVARIGGKVELLSSRGGRSSGPQQLVVNRLLEATEPRLTNDETTKADLTGRSLHHKSVRVAAHAGARVAQSIVHSQRFSSSEDAVKKADRELPARAQGESL